jgi:hypothetical protein
MYIYEEDGVQMVVLVESDEVVDGVRKVRMRYVSHYGGRDRGPFGNSLPSPGDVWVSEARVGYEGLCWDLREI